MIPLPSHSDFEELYSPSLTAPVLIYFTATWCGACKKLDWDFILDEFPNLTVYICDIDTNKYTPGYCGVKSIPSMIFVYPGKKVIGPFQSSDTAKVATWIHTTTKQHGS
jgi:thioredoxin-like negative regulator of GroEL